MTPHFAKPDGTVRVTLGETEVVVRKDGRSVWLSADDLRWLCSRGGPQALEALERQVRARSHLGVGLSPSPSGTEG